MLTLSVPAAAAITLAPGQPLDHRAAVALLTPALAEAAGTGAVRLLVAQPPLPLNNPYPQPATLTVDEVRIGATDRFVASVAISVGGRAPLRLQLSGELDRLVAVPVPVETIPAGARLHADQFETRWLAPNRVRGAWVSDVREIAGAEAYRALVVGRPVTEAAVGRPLMVRRGDSVTIVVERQGLRLEATGTARGDAGLDESVEVRNDRSGSVVRGRARGPARVHVEVP